LHHNQVILVHQNQNVVEYHNVQVAKIALNI
jgi:hypothetical protein